MNRYCLWNELQKIKWSYEANFWSWFTKRNLLFFIAVVEKKEKKNEDEEEDNEEETKGREIIRRRRKKKERKGKKWENSNKLSWSSNSLLLLGCLIHGSNKNNSGGCGADFMHESGKCEVVA